MTQTTADKPAQRLKELLERIVTAIGEPAKVEIDDDTQELRGRVEGQELGLLIGRNGQTVDAMQHIARRTVFRGDEEHKRVIVDVSGYRERRDEHTCRIAERAARKAIRYGRPVALDVMPASQRRIAHEFLYDWEDVETYSEGREPYRHLVIAPVSRRP
jgi:spoIIIJ-associated protein